MSTAHVAAILDKSEPVLPEPPRPLRRAMPPAEPFPVDALGDVLAPAAEAIHMKVQAPTAICAQSVLAAATLAAQAHADVELPTGQARPLSSFFITIAASGERKSSTDAEALWPIRKHENNLREKYEAEYPGYLNARDAWTKQRDQILANKKQFNDQHAKRLALDELGAAPTVPLNPMLVCAEPTLEGLERLFAVGQPSMGIFSGEGGQFIGGHGMREEAKLRTSAALSNLWDGSPIRRVRAGDGAVLLPGRRLALHLMVQPDVANLLLSDSLLADQGLLSRLLVAAPPSAAGSRFWRETDANGDANIRRFGARLLSILEEPLPLTPARPNELTPRAIPLDAPARRTWIAFADHVEREMAPGGDLEPIRGLANKLPEHAARLAAVLSLVVDLRCREVDVSCVERGIDLAQHYAAEALRLFDLGASRPDLVRAERLLGWLTGIWTEPLVSLPDIYQLGPNAIRDKKSAAETVALLEEHGWLVRLPGGAIVRGTRRQDVWRIFGRHE